MLNTAACSAGASSWIESDGTNIYIKGDRALLTYFDGMRGEYAVDNSLVSARYKKCEVAFRDCPENREKIHEADLSSYKDADYFDAYLGSYSCMHLPLKGDNVYCEGVIHSIRSSEAPIEPFREDVYKTMTKLKFEPITKAVFSDAIEVKSPDVGIIVRNTDITIPGVLTVGKGTKDCTQQVDIGEITCMKYSSNNYDFYQYGDNLIKIKKGIDPAQYVRLLELE